MSLLNLLSHFLFMGDYNTHDWSFKSPYPTCYYGLSFLQYNPHNINMCIFILTMTVSACTNRWAWRDYKLQFYVIFFMHFLCDIWNIFHKYILYFHSSKTIYQFKNANNLALVLYSAVCWSHRIRNAKNIIRHWLTWFSIA